MLPHALDQQRELAALLDPEEAPAEVAPPTIGSSDVAAILGVSRWGSPWETWARLVGLIPRYSSTPDGAQARGNMFEVAIGARYAEETGVTLRRGPPISEPPLLHPDEPWRAARPDFLAEDRLVEAKTTRRLSDEDGWGAPGSDRVPVYYACQVVWQLSIVSSIHGIERGDLAAFGTLGEEWAVYTLRRRERLERALVARVRDWYEAHVLTGDPPVVDHTDGCGRALARLHRDVAPGKVRLDPTAEDLALARDLARVRRLLEETTQERDLLQHRLCARIGDAYGMRGVADWSPVVGRSSIDAAGLRRDHPEIAAAYTKTGEPSRRFTFTFKESE